MQNIIAFLTVLIVWSTTPLAIKFASMGATPIFAASMRMFIAGFLCVIILLIIKKKLGFIKFFKNYFLAGIGIFITLGLVYIAARKIDSGIIAIIFALTPLITGIIANIILKNKEFDKHKLIATILGFIGMITIFFKYENIALDYFPLFLLFFAMSFQAYISVKLKQLQSNATAMQTTTGGILFSVPLFIISFAVFEQSIPKVSDISLYATIYLAIFGSILGFVSYYYLIKNVSVLTVGVIPLITPIFALILGYHLGNETINNTQIIGFIVVLLALLYYQFYERFTKIR